MYFTVKHFPFLKWGFRFKAFYGARDGKFLCLDKVLHREVLCLPAEMSFALGEKFSKGLDECRLALPSPWDSPSGQSLLCPCAREN